MKKYLLGAASLLLVAAAAIGGYSYHHQSQLDPSILENIEALSSDDESGGVVKCNAGWTQCATNGTTTLYKK